MNPDARVIASDDGINSKRSDTRNDEKLFHDDRSTHQIPYLQPDDGHHANHGVLQCMAKQHLSCFQTLCNRRPNIVFTKKAATTEIAHCFALACERCDFIATEESANRILQAVPAQLVDLTATVARLKARRRGEVHAKKPAEKLAAGESVP